MAPPARRQQRNEAMEKVGEKGGGQVTDMKMGKLANEPPQVPRKYIRCEYIIVIRSDYDVTDFHFTLKTVQFKNYVGEKDRWTE